MGKTVIIGIDGADWSILKEFIEKEITPNLADIYEKGAHGELKSVIPPISVPAWLCFGTGKRPDKLDLYNFVRREKGTYNLHSIHNSEKYQKDCFWNQTDISTGVIGIPSAFATGDTEYHLSGPLAPSKDHPEDIKQKIGKEYRTNLPKGWNFSQSMEVLKNNLDFISELRKEKPDTQLFIAATSVTDRVQHAYWDDREKLEKLYKEIDTWIGEILDELEEKDRIFIVSDHGFTGIEKTFYLNTWLKEQSFLSLKNKKSVEKEERRFKAKKTVKKILTRLGILEKAIKITPDFLQDRINKPEEIWDKIDWKNTKAYSSGQYVGQIYLNTEKDHPKGIVTDKEYKKIREEIIQKLKELEDPETGEKVVGKIWKKEEIYRETGKHAPDITFFPKKMKYKVKEEIHESLFDESIPTGAHRQKGVFLAAGKDITQKEINIRLIDIAPTVLHLLDNKVPSETDGKVRKEIFKENSEVKKRKVKKQDKEITDLKI